MCGIRYHVCANTRGKGNVVDVQLHTMCHVSDEFIRLSDRMHNFSGIARSRHTNLYHHKYCVSATLSHAQVFECDMHIARRH